MRSCSFDAFSKVRHTSTGFPKRCDRILLSDKGRKKKQLWEDKDILSDKDIFKTELREVYIMMILCDTEI